MATAKSGTYLLVYCEGRRTAPYERNEKLLLNVDGVCMGRKNEIEGQLNFFDMLVLQEGALEEETDILNNKEQKKNERKKHIIPNGEKQGKSNQEKFLESPQRTEASKGVIKVAGKLEKHYTPGTFPECSSCWCATCEHSTVGGSIPRPFAGMERPCPSCELCISQGAADICVIGSADEGCRYRAEKEGLTD